MTIDFAGRTVIVTGAGNGLGRAHALELGRRHAHVVVNDLGSSTDGQGGSRAAADLVVDEIRSAGGSAVASYDSVADDGGCRAIAALARRGARPHRRGRPQRRHPAQRAVPRDDRRALLPRAGDAPPGRGLPDTCAVYPTMVEQGYGRIVFTSSGTGAFGRPDGANYASAKAALLGLCNALAIEGAEHGILANAILPVAYTRLAGAPDITDTSDQAVVARAEAASSRARMLPEWVSPMVVYLASEECTRTRHYYSAALGRFARVFIAATVGLVRAGRHAPDRRSDRGAPRRDREPRRVRSPRQRLRRDRQDHRALRHLTTNLRQLRVLYNVC